MKLFVNFALQAAMIVFCNLARHTHAAENIIHRKNTLFMYKVTMIDSLYRQNQIQTSHHGLFTREKVEDGQIPLELFDAPVYSYPEIFREANDDIERLMDERAVSDTEKQEIIQKKFIELANTKDPQVIEGAALAVAPTNPQNLMHIFLQLNEFQRYAPEVFLESRHISPDEIRSRQIVKLPNIEYQFSKIKIRSVTFTHTLRYEVSSEKKMFTVLTDTGTESKLLDLYTVAWEIDPSFEHDRTFPQKGVHMNNGIFLVQPYVAANGIVDPYRSLILYHIYIKMEKLNFLLEPISNLLIDSTASSVIFSLADAMRKEAMRYQ